MRFCSRLSWCTGPLHLCRLIFQCAKPGSDTGCVTLAACVLACSGEQQNWFWISFVKQCWGCSGRVGSRVCLHWPGQLKAVHS